MLLLRYDAMLGVMFCIISFQSPFIHPDMSATATIWHHSSKQIPGCCMPYIILLWGKFQWDFISKSLHASWHDCYKYDLNLLWGVGCYIPHMNLLWGTCKLNYCNIHLYTCCVQQFHEPGMSVTELDRKPGIAPDLLTTIQYGWIISKSLHIR